MVVQANSLVRAAPCPTCHCWIGRLHGSYQRHLAERPILDKQVVLCVEMRRFKCMHYATGLRASELVHATLGAIEIDHEERWLHVVGKGNRAGRVTLPPLARSALDRYLVQRGLQTTPKKWNPQTPLVGDIGGEAGINRARLWVVMKRFFATVADILAEDNPAFVEKLHRATPHWMRHTHATHALHGGAELTAVRDNLRHASIATTSIYLHSDDVKRARQMAAVFAEPTQ